MSISSPVERGAKSEPAPESSSLWRWILIAAALLVFGTGITFGVQLLTKKSVHLEAARKYDGPPGKVTLDEETKHEFGVMSQQKTGKHTWKFRNTGRGKLILSKGPSTCSCTIANFPNEDSTYTLEPGAETEITLTWQTRESDGKFQKSATVMVVGDPDRDSVVFEVEGIVKPAITTMPENKNINFATIEIDATPDAPVALASSDRPDFKVLGVTSSRPDAMDVDFHPLNDAERSSLPPDWKKFKNGWVVTVKLKKSKALGDFAEQIFVKTDHPDQDEVVFDVGGRRVGPITVLPEKVQLHNVPSSKGGSETILIQVRNSPETTFSVDKAPKNLKVEIVSSDVKVGSAAKIRTHRMIVTVPPGTAPETIDEPIVLKSTHPDVAEVKIQADVIVLEDAGDN